MCGALAWRLQARLFGWVLLLSRSTGREEPTCIVALPFLVAIRVESGHEELQQEPKSRQPQLSQARRVFFLQK